jgi:flagellar basal body rod protein FlgG
VKAVDEMVRMITLLRAYEANQKIIQTHDERSAGPNNLGRLG